MAPLPVVPSVLRVACKHLWGADTDVLSRFFIQYTGAAPTAAQLVTFAAAVEAAWAAHAAGLAANDVSLTSVVAIDLTSATSAEGTWTGSTAGSRGAAFLPADNAAVASYEINRRYRGGHARGYWPFGVVADVGTPQAWVGGSVTAFAAGLGGFFSTIIGDGWSGAGTLSHVNVSLFSGFTVEISPSTGRARNVPTKRAAAVIDQVLSLVVQDRIGSQRRRLGKA